MISRVVIRPLADADIRAIEEHYENIRSGLASGFITKLESLLALISIHPHMYAIRSADIRAVRIRKSPFVLYYVAFDDEIHVSGVLHGARHESVWQSRGG